VLRCRYAPAGKLIVSNKKMSHKRKGAISVIAFGLLATLWLFAGIYRDREWGDLRPFIKYRPSPKVYFYSPLGEADQSDIPGHEGYITAEQHREENAYVQFVEENWLQK
jgi:hypothetical protein